MMKRITLGLGVALLSACQGTVKPETARNSVDAAEVQALLGQKYIDPLTDYLRSHDSASPLLAEVRRERERRCAEVGTLYQKRAKTEENLKKLESGYAYSCPQVVQRFAAQTSVAVTPEPAAAPPSAGVPPTPPVSVKPPAAAEPATPPAPVAATPKPAPSVAKANLEDCTILFSLENYLEAIDACLPAAQQGSGVAQYRLGKMYFLLKKYPEAAQWTQQAVTQNLAEAQYLLGQLYAQGQGVELDPAQAGAWFLKAAQQGLAQAQLRLGQMYLGGLGLSPDANSAARWLSQAAQQGDVEAQIAYAQLYLSGQGVKQNPEQARQWLQKAAAQGSADAQYRLGQWYAGTTPPDYAEAYAWFGLAALSGAPQALAASEDAAQHLQPPQLEQARQRTRRLAEQYGRK